MERRRCGLSEDHRGVEVAIVDLIAARAAEELGAIDVDGDLVATSSRRLRVRRRVRRTSAGRRVAVNGGAGNASVKARATAAGVAARAAERDLAGVPADRGAASRRLDPETILQSSERVGPVPGSEIGEVGTRLERNLAVDPMIVVVAVDLRRHCRWRIGLRLKMLDDDEEEEEEEEEEDEALDSKNIRLIDR